MPQYAVHAPSVARASPVRLAASADSRNRIRPFAIDITYACSLAGGADGGAPTETAGRGCVASSITSPGAA